jgi:Fic family protein
MVDPDIPHNSLAPLPPDGRDFETVEILKLCIDASRALSRLDGQTSTAYRNFANAFNMIKLFSVPEAVASSAVENIVTTVAEALQARALPKEDVSPQIKETDKYTDALIAGFNQLKANGFLATNDFIKIQETLGLPMSGIRSLPDYKIADDKTGHVYYSPPEGVRVIRNMLKSFEDYFNDTSGIDPLIKVALIHYQFEAIHPFPDGNGRTGRILMPLYLAKNEYLKYPILFLSDYILNNKSEYYRRLREVTYESKWEEWIVYILKGIIMQANQTSKALDEVTQESVRYESLMPKAIPSFRQTNVIDFLFSNVAFNREMLADQLKVGINTSSSYLNALVKAGLLSTAFVNRKKVFFIPKVIATLSNVQK